MKYSLKRMLFIMAIFAGMLLAQPSAVPVKSATGGQFHIDLWYDNSGHYSSQEKAFTQLIQTQLQRTGYFSVTLHTTDWSTFGSQIGSMPAFMLGWFYDYFDESNYIIPFEQTGYGLGTNYSNPTMDGLINQMLTNASARSNAILNAQAMMANDPVVIPLVTRPAPVVVYTPDLSGVYLQKSDNINLGEVSKTGATSFILGTTGSIGSSSSAIDFSGCYSFDCSFPLRQMSHGIFELDPVTSAAVPGPATLGYNVSSDGLMYTFNFNTSKKFTDGTNLTPDDVAWSLNRSIRLNETAGGPSALLSEINHISVINSTAIQVNLTNPDITLLQRFCFTNAFIFKKDSTYTYGPNGVTDRTTYGGNDYLPVGLGPYYINGKGDFTPGAGGELTLTASPYYNSGPKAKNNVTIQGFTDSAALTTAIKAKTIDMAYHTFASDDLDTVKADTSLVTDQLTSGFFIRYMVINVDAYPDQTVRQAMTYAINRTEIVNQIFGGHNTPLYSMVPSGFPLGCSYGQMAPNGQPCYYPKNNQSMVAQLMESKGYSYTAPSTKNSPGFDFSVIALVLITSSALAITKKKRKNV